MSRLHKADELNVEHRIVDLSKQLQERKGKQFIGSGSIKTGHAFNTDWDYEGYLPAFNASHALAVLVSVYNPGGQIIIGDAGYVMYLDHATTPYRPYNMAQELAAGSSETIQVDVGEGANDITQQNFHRFRFFISGSGSRYIQFRALFQSTYPG